MNERIAWYNGEWIAEDAVRLSLSDWGLLQAATVVDRLRTFDGKLLDVAAHVDRFLNGCQTLGISVERLPLGDDSKDVATALQTLLSKTASKNLDVFPGQDCSVVLLASPGDASSAGLVGQERRPTLLIHTTSIPWVRLQRWYRQGQPLVVTDVCNVPAECWPPQLKTRARLQYYLADRTAHQVDPDAGALLQDADGNLTETSVGNVLIVEGDELISPPLASILHGVSLQRTLDLAERLSVRTRFEPITLDRAFEAQAVVLTGTTGCIWRAASLCVKDRRVEFKEADSAASLFRRLSDGWKQDIGVDFEQLALAQSAV